MSFVQRLLTATITLGSGNFSSGGNTLTLSGLRMSATIEASGGPTSSAIQLTVWGLTLDHMNQLSTVAQKLNQQNKNKLTLMAGDAQSGMTQVFKGVIANAFVDAQNMPNVCFHISGTPDGSTNSQPTKPTSVKGSGDVATVMGTLAKQAGFTLENNGVNVKLNNLYLWGGVGQQMRTLARHAGIEFFVENEKAVIVPAGKSRKGSIPLISPQTGMAGYPAFNQAAVIVKVLFNPQISYMGQVQIKSDLTAACGKFLVFHITHELESLVPHGKWFTVLQCSPTETGSKDAGDGGSE